MQTLSDIKQLANMNIVPRCIIFR